MIGGSWVNEEDLLHLSVYIQEAYSSLCEWLLRLRHFPASQVHQRTTVVVAS